MAPQEDGAAANEYSSRLKPRRIVAFDSGGTLPGHLLRRRLVQHGRPSCHGRWNSEMLHAPGTKTIH